MQDDENTELLGFGGVNKCSKISSTGVLNQIAVKNKVKNW